MENNLLILLIFAITYPLPMVVQPVLVRLYQVEHPEIGRKISHICYGLMFCVYPLLSWDLVIPITGLILVMIAQASFLFGDNTLRRLNVRMGSKGNNPQSAICFYLGFLLLYILFSEQYTIYLTSALILTFGDAFAAICGKKMPIQKYRVLDGSKSVGGSAAFFLTASIILMISLSLTMGLAPGQLLFYSVLMAAILTAVENITPYRMDNLTILLASAYLYQQVLLLA